MLKIVVLTTFGDSAVSTSLAKLRCRGKIRRVGFCAKYRFFEKEALDSTTLKESKFFGRLRQHALFKVSECLLYYFC